MFGFVSKGKYDAAVAENNALRSDLDKANTRITQLSGNKKVKSVIPDQPDFDPNANAKSTSSAATEERRSLAVELNAQGKTNEEIAENLGVKVSTVKTYLRGVKNADKGSN